MESFSTITKRELLEVEKSKRCCTFASIYAFIYLSSLKNDVFVLKKTNAENANFAMNRILSVLKGSNAEYNQKSKELLINRRVSRFSTLAEIKSNILKCDDCIGEFFKSLFLICGTVTDPLKDYRLELVFEDKSKRDEICQLLIESNFSPKISSRSSKHIIYLRSSEQIENFLAMIGAVNATFAVMNSKIFKEFKNNANRASNCDSANINKSLKANEKYIIAISYLLNTDKLDALPENLKETAYKRLEHRELNFEQLGSKFTPPISKSGIYHRLEKILSIYEDLKDK
ncbi:MAG: DNA-binding protein WhiA [Clostridia bacterium]|nr:DNA-binding protein WhiA [Clostridia bacterium]